MLLPTMYFELEVDLENGYYSDDAVDYDNSQFPDYHPQDKILAFHWNSRRWLPAILIGPVYANGMTPIRWYHDLDCVDDVAFADTMTIENGLDYAYNKGIRWSNFLMPEIGGGCHQPIPIQQLKSIYEAWLVAQSGRPRILAPTRLSNQRQKGLAQLQRCQLGMGRADLPAISSEH